jgi:hypothetical protein
MNTSICAAQALAIVADRAHRDELQMVVSRLGGGWLTCTEAWPTPAGYMAAVADPERIRARAPLIIFARGLPALATAVQAACAQLDDVKCAWLLLVEPQARDVATREMLRDAIPVGAA